MWNRKVFIRIIEMLLCVACVVALRVTDDESRRVFHYLRNRNREWSLLNNVTWGTIGAALASATCGGYIIITTGLLIAAATGELRGRKTELFLLGLGVVLYGIVGALSLASIDSVPEDLVDNAAVLGTLCLVTALVFIVDLLMKAPGIKRKHEETQTSRSKDQAKTTSKSDNVLDSNGKSSTTMEVTGSVNDGFQKTDSSSEREFRNQKLDQEAHKDLEHDQATQRPRSHDVLEQDRNRRFEEVERQLQEYGQNFDRAQNSGDSRRFREPDDRRKLGRGVFYENERYRETEKDQFQFMDQDDLDTPFFPTNLEARNEPIFARIVNPGVKVMKVERVLEGQPEEYRRSDSSQYDNVPTRMKKTSAGILKKNQDVTFDMSPLQKIHRPNNLEKLEERCILKKNQDVTFDMSPLQKIHRPNNLERLEERFSALQMTTGSLTGGQRDLQGPSSPTDPGYVRHTASNWPQELRTKTPSASPDHSKN